MAAGQYRRPPPHRVEPGVVHVTHAPIFDAHEVVMGFQPGVPAAAGLAPLTRRTAPTRASESSVLYTVASERVGSSRRTATCSSSALGWPCPAARCRKTVSRCGVRTSPFSVNSPIPRAPPPRRGPAWPSPPRPSPRCPRRSRRSRTAGSRTAARAACTGRPRPGGA